MLPAIKGREANWIGYILRRNCLLKDVVSRKIVGGTKVTVGRGRRRTQLLDDHIETREFEVESLDDSLWRTRFGRGYGHVANTLRDE
jgi:hypothetical protein